MYWLYVLESHVKQKLISLTSNSSLHFRCISSHPPKGFSSSDHPLLPMRQVNGSSIRPWWIHHHYWSIATCMILLTLPVNSPAVQVCVKKFLWWSAFQGSLMLVQNR